MKKRSALIQDIWMEIRRSRGRFLSILCIVMLGAGFFAGIKSTCPDMKQTAQQYFEDQSLMDMHLKSTMGFTEGDIQSLRNQPEAEIVEPGYSVDAFVALEGPDSLLAWAWSWKLGAEQEEDALNLPVLQKGRWPQAADECLAEKGMRTGGRFAIGDTISLFLEDGDIGEALKIQEFTVVGVVQSPLYINFERGSSSLGNGSVSTFLYLPEQSFAYEVYTDVFLTYKDVRGLPFYEDEYQDRMEAKRDELEQLAAHREQTRYDEIYNEAKTAVDDAQAELDQGQGEYDKNKADFDRQIAESRQKLDDARQEIDDGVSRLNQTETQLAQGQAQYDQGAARLAEEEARLTAAQAQLEQGEAQLQAMDAALQGGRGLLAAYSQIALPQDQPAPEETEALLAGLEALARQDESGQSAGLTQALRAYLYANPAGPEKQTLALQAEQAFGQIEGQAAPQRQQLADSRAQLEAGQAQLAEAQAQLSAQGAQLESGWTQLQQGRAQISQARVDYERGLAELEENEAEGQAQLEKARKELEQGRADLLEARHQLNDLGSPEWYLWDRTSNPGYAEFSQDAERVDRIAKVFPVFFILVAALVCLTTMTRMVEENRTQIGVLKALGYGKGAVAAKYLAYALSASLLGGAAGLAVGFKLFPTVIFNAYRIMYILPDCQTPFRWDYAFWCLLAAMACTGLSAFAACYRAMQEAPAQLMRPKAPPSGKRVLLERVKFVWRRLSFLQKVAVRNLFRYKKRIVMTVVGVAGCTALMVAGFGMQHAISSIVDLQYEQIFLYDAVAAFDDAVTADEKQEIADQLAQNPLAERAMAVRQSSVEIAGGKAKKSVYLFVPEAPEELDQYVNLRRRQQGDAVALPERGALLTEKMARLLDVSPGDVVSIHPDDSHVYSVEIVGIVENYTMNFVYLSPAQYRELWGEEAKSNAFLVNLAEGADQDELAASLLKNNNVLAVTSSDASGRQFRDIVGSLNYIVLVLIVCAGALAFVVLYNLASINVEERAREIATIKVLGFYDKEVSSYIDRESNLSALMGMAAGLLLGVPFLDFIIQTAEVDAVMFNPAINKETFLFSALLTVLFTGVVNFAMRFRLKKIDMVQSLKSVE